MTIAKDLFHAQQALTTLFLVVNKLQEQGNQRLQDITLRQMLAIPALIHAPKGQNTINHVARSLGTSRQNAKQIVDGLVKRGYLVTEASTYDKRTVNITITPEGEQAFRLCSTRVDEYLADIFGEFSTSDLECLYLLLQRLLRFDGVEPMQCPEHTDYDDRNAKATLQHHQAFFQRRKATTKEGCLC